MKYQTKNIAILHDMAPEFSKNGEMNCLNEYRVS